MTKSLESVKNKRSIVKRLVPAYIDHLTQSFWGTMSFLLQSKSTHLTLLATPQQNRSHSLYTNNVSLAGYSSHLWLCIVGSYALRSVYVRNSLEKIGPRVAKFSIEMYMYLYDMWADLKGQGHDSLVKFTSSKSDFLAFCTQSHM